MEFICCSCRGFYDAKEYVHLKQQTGWCVMCGPFMGFDREWIVVLYKFTSNYNTTQLYELD